MFDFLLDETTNDLVITDKDLVFTTTEQESLRQRLSIRLMTYKGEWFLNESYGIPYMQEIIGVTRSKKTVDNILLNNAKLELTASDSISNFESSYGVDARNYSLTFDVSTVEGVVEVDINSDPASEYTYPDPIVFNPYAGCGETIGISNTLFDYVNISGLPATNPNTGLPNDHTWINNWKTSPRVISAGVSAGAYHTVGLRSDGTVVATGWNQYGQCNISTWSDIVSIHAGANHTVGLKADGTLVATGWNEYGQCNVSTWSDIVSVYTGQYHTVGLKSDGTTIAVGRYAEGQCNVETWNGIVKIAAGYSSTFGVKTDGTVVVADNSGNTASAVGAWTNITDIVAESDHTVGIKLDGTFVAVGDNTYGQCNVAGWSDIEQISVGYLTTFGVKTDGTVVALGRSAEGQCNVGSWSNIKEVKSGLYHTVGLKADGTVVSTGSNNFGQCDVSSWSLS